MSREIKTRVWDTVAGVWLPQDDIGIDNLGNVYLFTEDTGELDRAGNFIWKCTLLRDSDRYKVMQFTGLKDKHGREIYEGDLLSHKFYSRPVVVTFEKGSFQAEDVSLYSDSIEVIGNIYEHGHLLETSQEADGPAQ